MLRKRHRPHIARTTETPGTECYTLQLFIAGSTPKSARAILEIKQFCETYLPGRYTLDIVDIYQRSAPIDNQLIATPMLTKCQPLPARTLVGNFSNPKRVVIGLDLQVSLDQAENEQTNADHHQA